MMRFTGKVFIDTSAWYAFLDRDDANHREAKTIMQKLREENPLLITHDYVILETVALIQRHLGMDAVRDFFTALLPLVEIIWVDSGVFESASASLIAAGHRDISLVDWVSFEIMRRHSVQKAFAFDRDFKDHGFEIVRYHGI